jgi:hypothetical protein
MEEVLFGRTLFFGLLLPWLDLWSRWQLYQCHPRWRTLLTAEPNVAVLREARLHHHGKLSGVLLKALKRSAALTNQPVYQCALDYLWRPDVDTEMATYHINRWISSTCNAYHRGPFAHYVELYDDAVRLLKRGDAQALTTWCKRTGFNVATAPGWQTDELWVAALQGGMPELAFSLAPGCNVYDLLVTCLRKERGLISIEYILKHKKGAYGELDRLVCNNFARTVGLPAVQWLLSYANGRGIPVDYERLYCQFLEYRDPMAKHGNRKRVERVLKWLCPLALAAFTRRYEQDTTVSPLYPEHGSHRDACRALLLWEWPNIHDQWHYVYDHDANCANNSYYDPHEGHSEPDL